MSAGIPPALGLAVLTLHAHKNLHVDEYKATTKSFLSADYKDQIAQQNANFGNGLRMLLLLTRINHVTVRKSTPVRPYAHASWSCFLNAGEIWTFRV